MFKRRKDGGFTLIELMIVIAVIGILAVVLVPKMSGVKDSAKYSGVTTNVKSVEAYVVANIDRWIKTEKTKTEVENLIINQFKSVSGNELKNPFGGSNAIATTGGADEGIVLVTVSSSGSTTTIEIAGYGIDTDISSSTSYEEVSKVTVTADGQLKAESDD
ncbi:type IV pilus assembly protein PilA [Desulfitobacterium sp. LBE]|uniref:type II secretion system protein n=1 Tax=Desulfitobacterium sp. LBE TaxID=884086 RepID=UPI00119A6CC3|nr:type II secretion system protein [Desulfitobacterium sp. LBE]TWH60636.1 type IV pilus assembly protein PilA [Desulfitobacterium sp. LBE]